MCILIIFNLILISNLNMGHIIMNSKLKTGIYVALGATLSALLALVILFVMKMKGANVKGKFIAVTVAVTAFGGSVLAIFARFLLSAFKKNKMEEEINPIERGEKTRIEDIEEDDIENLTEEDLERVIIDALEKISGIDGIIAIGDVEIYGTGKNGEEVKTVIKDVKNFKDVSDKIFFGDDMVCIEVFTAIGEFWCIIVEWFKRVVERFQPKKPKEPERNRANVTLDEAKKDLHKEFRDLTTIYDFIQKQMGFMFDEIFQLKNAERRFILTHIDLVIEGKKKGLSWMDIINDHMRKDEDPKKKATSGFYQNRRKMKKEEKEEKTVESEIAGLRATIKKRSEEIARAIDNLQQFYDSCKDHIKFYGEKRDEFIRKGWIQSNECVLEYDSENYTRVLNAAGKLLETIKELKREMESNNSGINQNNNVFTNQANSGNNNVVQNAVQIPQNQIQVFSGGMITVPGYITQDDIATYNEARNNLQLYLNNARPIGSVENFISGFVDVFEAIIDQMRGKFLGVKNMTFKQAFDNEARFLGALDAMGKHGYFIIFSRFLDTNVPPVGYNENNSPFIFSIEMIKAAKAYLASADRIFGRSGEEIRGSVNSANIRTVNDTIAIMDHTVNRAIEAANSQNIDKEDVEELESQGYSVVNSTQPCTSRQANSRMEIEDVIDQYPTVTHPVNRSMIFNEAGQARFVGANMQP